MRIRPLYRLAQILILGLARPLLGVDARGVRSIPPRGGCLIAANHKSFLDPMLLGAVFDREIRYFAKQELFQIPLFGRIIRYFGAIPVARGGFDRRGLIGALREIEAGWALLVFPEGTRIRRPGLGRPRPGIALLARQTGVPVVPVWLGSTWEPKRRFWRRFPVRVRVGAPLRYVPAASRQEGDAEFARILMASIGRLAAAVPGDRDCAGR